MRGDSFIKESVAMAHEECEMCHRIREVALKHYRENRGIKTRSELDIHWVEVTS